MEPEEALARLRALGFAEDDVQRLFVHFSDADVVRHKLVQRIVSAYREHSEAAGEGARE